MNSLFYIISKGFTGFVRNGYMAVASVITLTCCLLLTGSFGLLVYNLYVNLNALDELNEIVCIVNYDVSEKDALALGDKLKELDNVSHVIFVSKEEALDQMREKYADYPSILEVYEKENPLPFAYKVKYVDSEKISTLTYELRGFKEFKNVDDRADITTALENMRNTVFFIFLGFLFALAAITVIIVMNTVKMSITARSEEITVMRYIGATKQFISIPFILESFISGIISICISIGIEYCVYTYLFNVINTDADINSFISVVPFSEIGWILLAFFASISTITCYIGSKISLRGHVKA